jgi:hypothetical protein
MSPETLAAMLTDTELETRAAELADNLLDYDRALANPPPVDSAHAVLEWLARRELLERVFRALWRALRAIRAEQRRRYV